MLDCKHK